MIASPTPETPKLAGDTEPELFSVRRRAILKKAAGIATAAVISLGGIKAGEKIFDDGIYRCGETLEIELSSAPNARLAVGDEVYGMDVVSLVGSPLVTLTEGATYQERQGSDPVVVPMRPVGTDFTGSIELNSQSVALKMTPDLLTVDTQCR